MKFDAFHDYYLGSREEDIYLVSVDAGTEVEEPYDKLEAITMREAMEFYATFVKGWRSKDQRPPRQKNPDSIFPLWLAYNFRLLSKAVGNFISKGN